MENLLSAPSGTHEATISYYPRTCILTTIIMGLLDRDPHIDPKKFGHIPGVAIGTVFESRQLCSNSGVHPGIMAGIYGTRDEGARSVCLSGGYEDDVDEGDTFTYTGCGGRDLEKPNGKKLRVGPQAVDQSFDHKYNAALRLSSKTRNPVRVVRGFKLDSVFAPAKGYRYDGLYVVEKAWMDVGQSGHQVCRFFFRRLPNQPPIPIIPRTQHPPVKRAKQRHARSDDLATMSLSTTSRPTHSQHNVPKRTTQPPPSRPSASIQFKDYRVFPGAVDTPGASTSKAGSSAAPATSSGVSSSELRRRSAPMIPTPHLTSDCDSSLSHSLSPKPNVRGVSHYINKERYIQPQRIETSLDDIVLSDIDDFDS
ncbi:hypothetical protein ABKN59_005245 [Abortiporus biennis]